ncbi:hypothetical protein Ocin01_12594 [Orchesella cincta]|uniref:Uncharacterized protein n=1 Tax=Orchesella cincta TaxID=48709 RepID=A0A1D2MME0_ORCCI|nr:hypothetical protein Ocin01_12594 [Orchesella cincta]
MDNLDFEVTDAFAKTMSKGMMPSLSKLKLKRNSNEKKNSTASTSSTVSQSSTGSNESFDSIYPARRGSIWDERILVTVRNSNRLGRDILL